jgi:allantoinase
MAALTLRSRRVVLPDGTRPATIRVREGRIAAVNGYDDAAGEADVLDAGDATILPGLVDTHVHINDPGRADWEGFDHATMAAAAGGVTTLVDMPLNSIPPTTTVAGLAAKRDAARGRTYVDVGYWGGVVPGNVGDLEPLARAGVLGFKCFLCPSGVDEFGHVGERDLRVALPVLAQLRLPLLVHAELPELLVDLRERPPSDPRAYKSWLASRPPASEAAAIDLVIRLAREFGIAAHIVHLASGDAIAGLRRARASGVSITVETCPHYLTFAAEEIDDGAAEFKCAPPIRSRSHRDALWRGLLDGDIDFIASDHSPAPPKLKHLDGGDLVSAWGGIASLQIGLAAVWTNAASRGCGPHDIARWMSERPARFAGLADRKGAIAVGRDADLVIWDADAETVVDPATLYHRHPATPYAGRRLRGKVLTTILRGEIVYDAGQCRGGPRGQTLTRLQ